MWMNKWGRNAIHNNAREALVIIDDGDGNGAGAGAGVLRW